MISYNLQNQTIPLPENMVKANSFYCYNGISPLCSICLTNVNFVLVCFSVTLSSPLDGPVHLLKTETECV